MTIGDRGAVFYINQGYEVVLEFAVPYMGMSGDQVRV
jgi:hypothetical protein